MQVVQNNQSPHVDDGEPSQPGTKRYRIWFWRESVAFREDEAENKEQLFDWLYGCLWKHDQMDGHFVVRIDDLGLARNDVPIEDRPSRAEYFATVR